jgi:transposase
MKRQVKELDFSGETIYVGIDVHLKSWKVATALENCLQKVFSQEPSPKNLVKYLHKHYPNGTYICTYEAGFCGFWIQESLEKLGVTCKVVNAADVPTMDKERCQKTDSRDCRKLVRCLRDSTLEFIYIPTKENQRARSIVRARKKIKRDVNRVKNRITSHLHFYGIEEPHKERRIWSKKHIAWLEEVEKKNEDITLSLLLKELANLEEVEKLALKKLKELSNHLAYKEDLELLQTVPGIGLLAGLTILLEIGDIKRFKTLDKLCSMVGLIPNTNSSGERERSGEMTNRGKSGLRTILIESSWVAIRKDTELSLCYNKYCQRMQGTQAIVKVAKKLLNRIRRVLLKKTPYVIATA